MSDYMEGIPEISIKAEPLFELGGLTVTNSVFVGFIVMLILVTTGLFLKRKLALIPGRLQGVLELLIEQLIGLMESLIGDRQKAERYVPLVTTIFLFILLGNWFGLLPGVGSITWHNYGHVVPLFRAPTADLNFTVALAIIAVISINLFGILALGFKRHAGKFFHFKNPIMSFVGLLELLSEFVKIGSFSFRLFGNIFAGEVLLTIVGFLAPYFIPLPFLFLEVFVGLIQALIFTMLSIVFIAMSVTAHDEAHAH